jgi:hypothetical protein
MRRYPLDHLDGVDPRLVRRCVGTHPDINRDAASDTADLAA